VAVTGGEGRRSDQTASSGRRSGTDGLSPDPRIAHDTAINHIFALLAQLWLRLVVHITTSYHRLIAKSRSYHIGKIKMLSMSPTFSLSPLIEVPARGSKIDGIEAFRKPGIDGIQKLTGLAGAALAMAQPPKAHRSAQFPRQGALAAS
jgi:hypothetical protein